jgi:hypothetical protein
MLLGLQVVSKKKKKNKTLIVGGANKFREEYVVRSHYCVFCLRREVNDILCQQFCTSDTQKKFQPIPFQTWTIEFAKGQTSVCVLKYEWPLYVINASHPKQVGGTKKEEGEYGEKR